jgi:hypothetical protein
MNILRLFVEIGRQQFLHIWRPECKYLQRVWEVPTGFYTQSRIFCFLPLPVETTLPLHINGCFMVENDRKSLVRFNKDNKTNDNSSGRAPSAFNSLAIPNE